MLNGFRLPCRVFGKYELPDDREALRSIEHTLCTAEPDSFGPKRNRVQQLPRVYQHWLVRLAV